MSSLDIVIFILYFIIFFFFKQKTAYEMRISDWSSDVCSSDLKAADPAKLPNFDFMDDTRWTYVKGHIHGSGYYELFTDNILDLGHAAFLHTGLSAPAFTIGKRHVFQDGDTVWSNVSHPNDFISDIMNNMFNSHGKRLDRK